MNTRFARISAWLIALALVATPIIATLNGWLADERWPITQLSVQSRFLHVSEAEVRAAVAPGVRAGFFAVDLDVIKTNVEHLPWVATAEVRKHWPDRIEVRVTEREPIAHWGAERLLGSDGVLFAASKDMLPEHLPRLGGPDAHAVDVWARHREFDARLQTIGIEIIATQLNERGAWSAITADRAEVVLGRDQPIQRLERFVAALSRLPESERARIARADLRFANGFAVVWRAPAPVLLPDVEVPAPAVIENRSAHEPQV